MTTTIQLRQLSIGYTRKHHRKVVASGICADLESGRMTCLIGPNGVGKSTLLRTLAAFQPPLDGQVMLMGKDMATYKERQLARLIGVVLTAKTDVQNMTAQQLVEMGRSPYTGFWGGLDKEDREVVAWAIDMVGVRPLADRMVQTLSDGERQKVMIAKALAQQTPVVFLDEPTAFLDYPSKVEMMQLLHRLSRTTDKTIFLSTHDLELALQIADTVWLMGTDNSLSVGTPRQLADNGMLAAFVERRGITFDRQTLSVRVVDDSAALHAADHQDAQLIQQPDR